jgi:hypothetical protein
MLRIANPLARSIITTLATAALTAGVALAVLWPRDTLADGDGDNVLGALQVGDDQIGHVTMEGELVKDAKAKSGWAVEVTLENVGTEAQTAQVETDVTRAVSNPMARAMPTPRTVWSEKESVTLAAGEKVTRHYPLPVAIGRQLTANAQLDARVQAAMEKAPGSMPRIAMQPRPFFGVRCVGHG